MCLQCELAGLKRFVFVNMDLERVLPASELGGTSEDE